MKIAVIGPGAMGCLLAASLKQRTKEEVWLIDRNAERVRKIAQAGITVEGMTSLSAKVDITATPKEVGDCDLVIVCVKSYETEDACKTIKPLVSDRTRVLTLQNGIGNVQILDDHFGAEKVFAGVTNHGATLLATGRVRHAGKGDTIIGKSGERMLGWLRDIGHVLTRAGFDTKISRDIDSVIWGKLIINVGINALTAITRLNNGRLVEHDGTRQLMRQAVQEAVKVVKRKRIKLAYDDPIQKVESVCKATAANVSSMLQDVLRKERTEVDFINGAIVRQAKSLGIPTPVNEAIADMVKTIEEAYEEVVK